MLCDRRRSDEADRPHVRVLEQSVHRDLVAVHDVEHARRETRVVEELGDQGGRRRIPLRGLEHEGVPAGDRDREHPQRHHGRKVEGGDAGDDAEGTAYGVDVHPGRGLLVVAALQVLGEPARELDVLQAPGDLAPGVAQHLAVLGGELPGDVVRVLLDQVAVLEHQLRTLRDARVPPSREGSQRRRHRGIDLLDRREQDLTGLSPRRGVEDRGAAARRARHGMAVDDMGDLLHGSWGDRLHGEPRVPGRIRCQCAEPKVPNVIGSSTPYDPMRIGSPPKKRRKPRERTKPVLDP